MRSLQEYSGGAERTRGATLVSDGEPVQSGLVSASPSRIVELFHFGRGECAIVEACRPIAVANCGNRPRTHFTFRVDTWTPDGESIVEHVAGIEDYQVALATYRAL
jgi:hypothetical protein